VKLRDIWRRYQTARRLKTRGLRCQSAVSQKCPQARYAGRPDLDGLSITHLSANPIYNAQVRTTCVATQIQGGHAVKAPAKGERDGQLPRPTG